MFFGRRKHAAPAPAAPAPVSPELTDELVFAAVQRSLESVFGEDGEWTVARRSDEQTDSIFHEVLVHSIATTVTAGISAAREANAVARDELAGGPLGLLRAPRTAPVGAASEVEDEADEPAALRWEPAPITRWADLKRPVTGPVAVIDEDNKAA